MEWIERFNDAIGYIEEHLTEEIDYGKLGQIACCSSYHFQRMFTYMAGIPLSEYIRRRKMSLAAVDLQGKNMKIIEVAGKYGYNSPTAFNRAFQSVHGIAPSAVKNGGVSVPLHKDIEKNFAVIPLKWQEISLNGTLQRLIGMMDTPPMGVLGVSTCNDTEPWRYYIAVSASGEKNDFEEYIVPAATWAIFSGEGTNQSIQELERRIVTEWLPTSGYEYGNAPDIEVYLNPDPQNAQYEVWIPVIPK